uniref:Uncharacterized protein n=1 Tax=Anguilla anguilla TaxID=7936 RepID=A0A0E9UM52_ANGAN
MISPPPPCRTCTYQEVPLDGSVALSNVLFSFTVLFPLPERAEVRQAKRGGLHFVCISLLWLA